MGKRKQTRGLTIISGRLNNRATKTVLFRKVGHVYLLSIFEILRFVFFTFSLYYNGTLNHLWFPLTFKWNWI